jgi:serine/threonine protein kinase
VLHRDIKAGNIFLLGNGRLVLGDLGISKVLGEGASSFAQTQIGEHDTGAGGVAGRAAVGGLDEC